MKSRICIGTFPASRTAQSQSRPAWSPFRGTPFHLCQSQFRACQRSGEGVVRRNSFPKECFWRVRFFSAPLRFALKTRKRSWKPYNKEAEKKRILQKDRFGRPFLRMTPSPLLWCAPISSECCNLMPGGGFMGWLCEALLPWNQCPTGVPGKATQELATRNCLSKSHAGLKGKD